jgi:large-conductance mechanosensitive channel
MMKEMLEDWKEYLMILAGATMLTAVIVIIGIALTAALFSVVSWLGWLR